MFLLVTLTVWFVLMMLVGVYMGAKGTEVKYTPTHAVFSAIYYPLIIAAIWLIAS